MKMVDGCCFGGWCLRRNHMPQTRFDWKKALEQDHVQSWLSIKSINHLLVQKKLWTKFLNSSSSWCRWWPAWFPSCFASSDSGTSSFQMIQLIKKTQWPIFDTIIDHIQLQWINSDEPLQFQVSLLDYNDFVGRISIGRLRGTVKVGDQVTLSKLDGTTKNFRVTKLFGFFGRTSWNSRSQKRVTWLLSLVWKISLLEKPSHRRRSWSSSNPSSWWANLQMTFLVNNSPFAGRVKENGWPLVRSKNACKQNYKQTFSSSWPNDFTW